MIKKLKDAVTVVGALLILGTVLGYMLTAFIAVQSHATGVPPRTMLWLFP